VSKTSDKDRGSSTETSSTAGESPGRRNLLLALAWLIPGLGHWLLGRKTRAVVFAVVIAACFITGVLVHGELGVPRASSPFSWLAAFACLGNGILYIGRLLWLNGLSGIFNAAFPYGLQGGGSSLEAGFSYGNTFLYTAGLMNLLTMLDVSDILRGMKE
jgi:hypothetical protein